MTDTNRLHLPDLTIKGFRGIDELSIPRLGRVTLLAGRNSVGKTTVLDAVRVYAARGRYSALSSLLWDREEVSVATDEDGDSRLLPDLQGIFHGRDAPQCTPISIGPENSQERLNILTTTLTGVQTTYFDAISESLPEKLFKTVYGTHEQILPWFIPSSEYDANLGHRTIIARRPPRQLNRLLNEAEPPPAVQCEFLGPGLLGNNDLARLWSGVVLTDDEERAVNALKLVFGSGVDDVNVIGEHQSAGRMVGPRAMAKLKGHKAPVPLKSLGDGAWRLFEVALALANSRGGFLLIDEAENGVHHSVQRDYWRMVLQTAHENNVQVLATTHSWDCVTGFAQAATELEDVEGVLVRLSRSNSELRAIEYPEEELAIAAEQGIEVR